LFFSLPLQEIRNIPNAIAKRPFLKPAGQAEGSYERKEEWE
jgi:hypothetical protein